MKNSHVAWIWKLWRERPWLIIILFVLTILSSAVAVANPFIIKILLDTIQSILANPTAHPDAYSEIAGLALLLIGVGFVGLVSGIYPGVRGSMNSIFENLIRSKFFKYVVEKDSRFFHKFRTGDIVTRLTDDIYDFPKLSWFLCSGIFRAVESLSKMAFCFAAMALIDWRLTLFSVIPIPLIIIVFYVASDRIESVFRKNQEAISAINNQLEMSFSGVRIIKAYATESKYRRFFDNVLAHRFGTEMAGIKLDGIMGLIFMSIDYIAQITIIFAGGLMAVRGEITIGTFYAFYNYLSMLIFPIIDLPQLFVSAKRAFVNIDRLDEMRSFPQKELKPDAVQLEAIRSLSFENVSYRYEGREEDAVCDLGFELKRGERVCVIGPVGSGKTTLVRLMLGLLDPKQGRIVVNGKDLETIDARSLRALSGYVPQEPLLFSGTIEENVRFGNPGMDKALYEAAISASQLSDEIESFAEKEKTVVGQRGVSLSGGQKQRLAIARALVRKPELLLLDDITASLDASNEERLMGRLSDFTQDITCLIVSHRLSTLQYVDRVLYMERGKILGFGTHEELMRIPSYESFISEHFAKPARPLVENTLT